MKQDDVWSAEPASRTPGVTRRWGAWLAIGCLSVGLWGCTGEMNFTPEGSGLGPDGKPTKASNNTPTPSNNMPVVTTPDGKMLVPTVSHLRRLTPAQYRNTVELALGEHFNTDDYPEFFDDVPTIGLSNDPQNLRISAVNIDSLYNKTQALARKSVTNTPVVKDCVEGEGDACWAEVVDALGPKLWRRPLEQEERDDLLETRATVAAAPATRAQQGEFLVQAMLASPNMLFRTELGAAMEGGALQLNDYEIASALSYTLWNAPPDAELYELAAQGKLHEEETLKAQTTRMVEDPRLADAMAEFFIDYLKIESIFTKDKDGSLGLNNQARTSLYWGVREDLLQQFGAEGATLLDPFLSDAFHVDSRSATFFGVDVQSENFELTAMDPSQRLGILSHPAFLSVHSGDSASGIVKRGVFTLEQLLCVHLGNPPNDIPSVETPPADFDPETATSREELHVLHSSQANCVGCHRIIDPAGFGFENYDAVGRYRTVEKGDVQIDASGSLTVNREELVFEDSVGYIDALVKSSTLRRCLSEQYMTYVLGDRPDEVEREAFYDGFEASNGELRSLAELIVTTPSFTVRRAPAEVEQGESNE